MPTWLSSFSLPNPFNSDPDNGDGGGDDQDNEPTTDHHIPTPASPNSTPSPSSGVKQDLSALSQTFSHHLRGVAAFLAPPPSASQQRVATTNDDDDDDDARRTASSSSSSSSSEAITGIKKDLVEIGGSFKSLFSSSSNKAATGISKFASNLLQFRDDVIDEDDDEDQEEEEGIAGINEEVVGFVEKVSLRPELWTDFPLPIPIDFDMSDHQTEHAATIKQLVPSLMTLRQTCSKLSDGQFWMIYFILLCPRLNQIDMELLSTSEIVQVRETLLRQLQNKRNAQVETSGVSETVNASSVDHEINATQGAERLSEEKDIAAGIANASGENEVETGKNEGKLEDKQTAQGKSLNVQKHSETEDDVSFSDLEDDDNGLSDRHSGLRSTHSGRGSSASESNEWVRLTENSGAQVGQNKFGPSTARGKDSEGEESNDWLTVDDIDLDRLAAA